MDSCYSSTAETRAQAIPHKTAAGPAPTFGHIQVEEVTVEDGLHYPRHHCNLVIEVLGLVAPDPVSQVERPIQPQEEQVVCGDGLGLSGLADHEELGQDSH